MSKKSSAASPVNPKNVDDCNAWSVYLLLCKGDVLYTGITNNVARRYAQHCAGKGANFTRSRPPIELLCHAIVGDRSAALKMEYTVKQLPRGKKVGFVKALEVQTDRLPE